MSAARLNTRVCANTWRDLRWFYSLHLQVGQGATRALRRLCRGSRVQNRDSSSAAWSCPVYMTRRTARQLYWYLSSPPLPHMRPIHVGKEQAPPAIIASGTKEARAFV